MESKNGKERDREREQERGLLNATSNREFQLDTMEKIFVLDWTKVENSERIRELNHQIESQHNYLRWESRDWICSSRLGTR